MFELVVTDGKETGAADSVTVDIVANSAAYADAGQDQLQDEGSTVTLDGSGSYDPDIGDTISYVWT